MMTVDDWLRPYLERNYELYQEKGDLPEFRMTIETLVYTVLQWQHEDGGDGGLCGMTRDMIAQPMEFQKQCLERLHELHLFERYKYDPKYLDQCQCDRAFVLTNLYLYGSDEMATHILQHIYGYLHRDILGDMLCMATTDCLSHQIIRRIRDYEARAGIRVWKRSSEEDSNLTSIESADTADLADLKDRYDHEYTKNYKLVDHKYVTNRQMRVIEMSDRDDENQQD